MDIADPAGSRWVDIADPAGSRYVGAMDSMQLNIRAWKNPWRVVITCFNL